MILLNSTFCNWYCVNQICSKHIYLAVLKSHFIFIFFLVLIVHDSLLKNL